MHHQRRRRREAATASADGRLATWPALKSWSYNWEKINLESEEAVPRRISSLPNQPEALRLWRKRESNQRYWFLLGRLCRVDWTTPADGPEAELSVIEWASVWVECSRRLEWKQSSRLLWEVHNENEQIGRPASSQHWSTVGCKHSASVKKSFLFLWSSAAEVEFEFNRTTGWRRSVDDSPFQSGYS